MTARCGLCGRRITWWQWRRGKTASVGPLGHRRHNADWIKHLACMRRARAERRAAAEAVPNSQGWEPDASP